MDYLAFRKAYRNDLLHVGKGHDDNPPGRGSGRYPYGSGKRPFQRGGGLFGRKKRKKKDEIKQEEQASKSRPTYIQKEFQSEQEKKKFLSTASNATEVLQYRDQLTQKEMQDALDRVKTIRELSGISKKEMNAGWDAIDDAMKKVGKVKDWGKTSVESYGVVYDIFKILNGERPSSGGKKK